MLTAVHAGYELAGEINVVDRELSEKHRDERNMVLIIARWSTEVWVTLAPNSP